MFPSLRAGCAITLCALALCFGPGRSARAEAPPLLFSGNVVLPDEAYRAVVDLALKARTKPPSAARMAAVVEELLTDFLHNSGYALATVDVRAEDGALTVKIEEGRLDRVVFPGQGIGHTFQLRLALQLPGDVFNAHVLNRKLAHLIETTDVERAEYEVVPVNTAAQTGNAWATQVIQGLRIIQPGQPHELHIFLDRQRFRRGLNLYLNYGAPDGLRLGLRYRGRDLLFEDDRYRILPLASMRVFEGVAGGKQTAGLSRLAFEMTYYTPPIAGRWLALLTYFNADAQALRRLDIHISRYLFTPLRVAAGLDVRPTRWLNISGGAGYQYRALLRTKTTPGKTPPHFVEERGFSWFAGGELRVQLSPDILRRDRVHTLFFRGVYNGPRPQLDSFAQMEARYRNVFTFGYDELWLQLEGLATLGGGAQFYDEASLGRFLRIAYGSTYARQAAGLKTEYRLSVLRDVVKFSGFTDLTTFERLDRDNHQLGLATNFGVGVHLLMLDAIQLNLYTGMGVSSTEAVAFGLGLNVAQAY